MGKKKILIVDFDQEFLKFLARFLRDEGFTVVTAVDGSAGLEMNKSEAPDLVITEAMLPKLHGFELCSRLSHSASRKVPVIIVTGVYRDTVYKTEAIHTFGAAAYFEKPLDPEDLLVSLKKILGLPEPKEKPEDLIDAAIMESLVAETTALPVPPKPAAKAAFRDEIDTMLQNTLAEFDLKPGKKKAHDEASAPKPQALGTAPDPTAKPPATPAEGPMPAPATIVAQPGRSAKGPRKPLTPPLPKASPAPPERRLSETPPSPPTPEPVEAVKPRTPVATPAAPPSWAPHAVVAPQSAAKPVPIDFTSSFGGYSEHKKKNVPPRIFGAIAGVLVLTSATLFVLKPGKKQSPVENAFPPVITDVVPGEGQEPAATDLTAAAIPEAPKKKSPESAPVRKDPKPEPATVASKPLPDPESIKSLNSEAMPSLEVLAQETAASPAGDAPAPADGGIAAGATDPPVEIPAVKVKAGDVIPLDDADVPPRQVRTANPVYPTAARSLGREGSIMINLLISETGDVIQTAVIGGAKGSLGFDKAAENAVRKWKFAPASKDGVPVRVWKPVTIAFKLQK